MITHVDNSGWPLNQTYININHVSAVPICIAVYGQYANQKAFLGLFD